jgi:glycosyltransferase involved in cell wall biosynthesis
MSHRSQHHDAPRVLHAITSSSSLILIRGQLRHLAQSGFDVSLVCPPDPWLDAVSTQEGFSAFPIPMQREISPCNDVVSLCKFIAAVRRFRPVLINVSTPKAGLLGSLAAAAMRVPCRVYTMRGLRFETARGMKRRILWAAERITCVCSHRVICVSPSLREKAIELGLVRAGQAIVLQQGSSNGVDTERFGPTQDRLECAAELRRRLRLPAGAPVIGFVGRLVRDKGIGELIAAFHQVRLRFPQVHFLLLGDFENGDPVDAAVRDAIAAEPAILCCGSVSNPEDYYPLMDVVALPSYREGYPNVVLEAQAASKAVVTTTATGCCDSIVDGVTGTLVPVADPHALAEALTALLADPARARGMGNAGRQRVLKYFTQQVIWEALVREYRSLLQQRGYAVPRGMPEPEPAGAASRP